MDRQWMNRDGQMSWKDGWTNYSMIKWLDKQTNKYMII